MSQRSNYLEQLITIIILLATDNDVFAIVDAGLPSSEILEMGNRLLSFLPALR